MNIRQRKRLMFLGAAALITFALAILAIGLQAPIDAGLSETAPEPNKGTAPGASQTSAPSASTVDSPRHAGPSLAVLRQRSAVELRRPLFDPPPEPTPQKVAQRQPPAQPMTVKFRGTIIEPGHALAVFEARGGKTELRGVGESIEDLGGEIRVTAIEPYKITVEYRGRNHELTIDPPTKPGLALNPQSSPTNQ